IYETPVARHDHITGRVPRTLPRPAALRPTARRRRPARGRATPGAAGSAVGLLPRAQLRDVLLVLVVAVGELGLTRREVHRHPELPVARCRVEHGLDGGVAGARDRARRQAGVLVGVVPVLLVTQVVARELGTR